MKLTGHTALITGATQGVGAAIARAMATAGADLVLHGLADTPDAQRVASDCRALGVKVDVVWGDLSGPTMPAIQGLTQQVDAVAPQVDLLVNNAGGYFDVPFLELDYDTFEKTMRLNVFSYFWLTHHYARRWVERRVAGRVLMVGSINGRLAERTHAAYDTSKGAVEMMVKTLCAELAGKGIRVNGLAPGLFWTPLTAPALRDPQVLSWMKLHTPNGEVPGPEAAGEAAVFLMSDAAAHIHGHMLMVDGGMSVWQQPDPPGEVRP
ncbi:MAG: SDR family oxidoreductase [Pirellulales bacterium]